MARESERKELWHQLDNESDRAHDAFKCYMLLPPAERTLINAWRKWSGNPDVKREPPYFAGWARDHAWSDRARAHDHHLEVIRERGMEAAIEQEAAEQARQVERVRNRYNEILARTYDDVISYLESGQFVENLRPSDVINVMKVYFEATKHFGEPLQHRENEMADWTPDEQAELERIVGEIEARDKESEESSEEGEEDSEESNDAQD
jgi:hypothetical protein